MKQRESISEMKRPLYLSFSEDEWNKMDRLFRRCGTRTMKLAILKAADQYEPVRGLTA